MTLREFMKLAEAQGNIEIYDFEALDYISKDFKSESESQRDVYGDYIVKGVKTLIRGDAHGGAQSVLRVEVRIPDSYVAEWTAEADEQASVEASAEADEQVSVEAHEQASAVTDEQASIMEQAEGNTDKEGICPVCGGEIEYDGTHTIDDDGGMFDWNCPDCGASGREGYNRAFDRHYYVTYSDGRPFPR